MVAREFSSSASCTPNSRFSKLQENASPYAAPDALLRPTYIYGRGSVCHQDHPATEMGICNYRDALDSAERVRVAVLTGLIVLRYVVTVYLIFFLTYTPLNIDHVRGVQGLISSLLCQWLLFSWLRCLISIYRGVLATAQ